MTVFQDILSDERVEKTSPESPLSLTLFEQTFEPLLLEVEIKFTEGQIKNLTMKVSLDSSSEIMHVQSIIDKCGYSIDDIKARVFTRIPVEITWQVKAEVLEKYQSEMLPYAGLEKLWDLKDEQGNSILLDLDQAYTLSSFEA